jgi:hypothetical protein
LCVESEYLVNMCDDMNDVMASSQRENSLETTIQLSRNGNGRSNSEQINALPLSEQIYALRMQNSQQSAQIRTLEQDVSFLRTAFSCKSYQ